jgi:hypothetical protein
LTTIYAAFTSNHKANRANHWSLGLIGAPRPNIIPRANHKGEANMKTLTKFRITYAAICLALFCAVAIPAHAATFPLKKSANNRYLTGQDGTPFMLVGDTVWDFINDATNADIDTYLANRASKGFNAVVIELIDPHYATNAPNNINNVVPFTTRGDVSTYNPTYFDRFDYLLDQASNYGIVVICFPLYLGYNCGNDGWGAIWESNSTANLQAYATFIGNRYKNKLNIIWAMGGDWSPFDCSPSLATKTTAFANALLAADPNHLITEHSSRGHEGIEPWLAGGVPSWFGINTTYTDQFTYSQGQTAYNRTPARPFFLIESYYENGSHISSRKDLRAEAYWALLSGNCGYIFGNCPLWGLSSPVTVSLCSSANPDWHVQMDNVGSLDMTKVKNLFFSVAWQNLVPDFTHTVVTAGYGSGTTTVTTGRASDGSFVISYLPAVSGVTVDMTRLTGSSVAARWYDPTNGTYSTVSGSPFPNTGTHVFTPTGNNSSGASDWVLILQSSSPTPKAQPSATQCSILQKRLDRLQLRQQRLRRLQRSNEKLSQRVRRLRSQLQLQACL